jgi:hypothetical protein
MHLLQLIVVLSAVLWWSYVRRRPAAWWMPLLVFEIAALMVKEDGVMLVPVIIALHVLRRYLVEPDLPYPPLSFAALAVVAGACVLLLRNHALQGIGGYQVPTLDAAWLNYRRGIDSVFRLLPATRPWQPAASWFVTLLPLVAALGWKVVSRPIRFGLAAGVVFAALFNLPFVFVVKVQQLHLVAAGASMLLASAFAATWQMARFRWLQMVWTCAAIAGVALLATVARDITRDFEPFGRIILATDDLVTGWAAVPDELRAFVRAKKAPGAASRLSPNPADALDSVSFGFHGWEGGGGVPRFRWMSAGRSEIHVRASARRVTIPLRCEVGAVGGRARARIEVDGRTLDDVEFDSGGWRTSELALLPAWVSPLRRMHRIVIHVDRTWVPARRNPRSRDARTLGLQVGEIALR